MDKEIKIVERELVRFLEDIDMTIEQLCINVNKEREKAGIPLITDIPFEMDGKIIRIKDNKIIITSKRRS